MSSHLQINKAYIHYMIIVLTEKPMSKVSSYIHKNICITTSTIITTANIKLQTCMYTILIKK